MSKYGSCCVEYDGMRFDSSKEARRYAELKILERLGKIENLSVHQAFDLIPAQRDEDGKVIERKCTYVADFVYFDCETGKLTVEDVKGYRDPASAAYAKYTIKRKLMLLIYGIVIKEV